MARKDPIAHLSRHTKGVPKRLVAEILALGPSAADKLVALATDRARWTDDDPTAGNALFVLTYTENPRTVEVATAMFGETDLDAWHHGRAEWVLEQLVGAALVEPLLALELQGEARGHATVILAQCGVRDPRITARIEELLAADPHEGVPIVRDYEDPALVPALQRAIDQLLAGDVDARDAQAALLAVDTLEALGHDDLVRARAANDYADLALEHMMEEVQRMQAGLRELRRTDRRLRRLLSGR